MKNFSITFLYSLFTVSVFIISNSFAVNPPKQAGFDPTVVVPNSAFTLVSSPTLVDLNSDGIKDIVFGDSQGKVHAYSGNGTLLWQHSTGNAGIQSKPAVADMDGDGKVEVIISAGSQFSPLSAIGSVSILNGQNGSEICRHEPPHFAPNHGVYGSVAVGNLDKSDPQLEFAYGDWGAKVSVRDHNCNLVWESQSPSGVTGVPLPGGYNESMPPHKVYVNDTVWGSPSIADINKDGQLDVIIGVDAHTDDTGIIGQDGGRLLVINGHNGTLQFAINTDEVIWSAPTIVDLDNDGSLDIVVGNGYCWQVPGCAIPPVRSIVDKIYAWNSSGQNLSGWPYVLGSDLALSSSSAAIADIDNDGQLEVVINVFESQSADPKTGHVLAIEHNGILKWDTIPTFTVGITVHYAASSSSPIIADITGNGENEIIVPSNWELIVYNKNGTQISNTAPSGAEDAFLLSGGFSIGNTASIADLDGDNDYELVLVSGNAGFPEIPSSIYVWDLLTPTSTFIPWGSLQNGIRNNGVFKKNEIFENGFD